ncbi:MAG: HEPN domain-containing protein [Candidatus Omnitrophica bacterium]|nr:HEPN domain-containing protein [Candidatus Omnitrophota bacterium]
MLNNFIRTSKELCYTFAMDNEVKNWIAMAEYDLVTSRHMLKAGRNVYVVFMCHMALEKTLKAVVCLKSKKAPPKTHDLIYLASLAGVALAPEQRDFIGKINNAAVVTRYPEDMKKLVASYPKIVVQMYLKNTREIVKCIKCLVR